MPKIDGMNKERYKRDKHIHIWKEELQYSNSKAKSKQYDVLHAWAISKTHTRFYNTLWQTETVESEKITQLIRWQ